MGKEFIAEPIIKMIANKVVFVLSSVAALANALPQQINLISKLPDKPIEDPAEWAWGEHPKNGFGFKARNSLTIEQCILNPSTAGTVHCRDYDYTFPVDICIEYPAIAGTKPCQGNTYPAEGCAGIQYPADVCASSIQYALLEGCAGAADEITFLQCVSDGAVCRVKICDKKIPNKDFCPAM